MIALLFDTETTGLPLHDRAKDAVQPAIIEWGGALVNGAGEVLEELDVLINPGVKLPAKITKITGLTDEDLATAPRFPEVAERLHGMFERADTLIAHNLPFDSFLMRLDLKRAGLLSSWPWPARNICTVQEHAEEWGRRPKLTELYQHYTGEKLAQTHRALDDVMALLRIVQEAGILK